MLLKAISSQNFEEVKRIIAYDKLAVLERDASRQTPLHIAVLCENMEILRYLLTLKKIDINAQDDNGWTALHCAANVGRYDMCLELLNNRSTRVDLYNSDGNGILIFICKIRKSPNIEFSLRSYYQCLQKLASKGIDVNYQNNFGETPLHYASMEGNLEGVYFLCKNNANVNILNNSNETPLMYAVRKNQITIVRKLLENKADTTIVNKSGFTAFDFQMSDELRELLDEVHSVDLAIKKVVNELEAEKKKLIVASTNSDNIDKKKKAPKYCKFTSGDLRVFEKLNLEFYLARASGWHCCMKKIECKDQSDCNTVLSELHSFIDDLNHPNLLQYLYHDKIETHVRLFNSIPSASLKEFLSQRKFLLEQNNSPLLLPIKELTQFALEIAEALEYLHANDILHRHLKSGHVYIILKDKGVHKVVVNNFYLCKTSEQWNVSKKNIEFYEPFYSIPIDARKSLNNLKIPFVQTELSSPRGHTSSLLNSFISQNNNNNIVVESNFAFTTQSDVWSYGILLYEMLTLSTPYSDITSEEKLIEVMKNSGPSIPSSIFSSEEEKEKYQNIIDIINVCTNTNPLQRPPMDLVANSIRMNINIQDLYGLKQRDFSSSFLSKEFRQDQYPILRAVKESAYNEWKFKPLIKFVPGYSIEDPIQSDQPNPSFIQFLDRSIPHFKRELFDRPHENFIGRSANNDIVIVSMESEGKFDSNTNKFIYFTLVRTMAEDTNLYISSDTPKDRLKALRSHPILANFKIWDRVKDNTFSTALLELESNLLESTKYKFGVIYRKSGQMIEDEMFANSNPSLEFDQFLNFLGDRITLKGWKKFRGGLDVASDTTGKQSVYTSIHENFEVIFHVSTLLPYDSVSSQQLHRKRHIGNDIIVVIFQDAGSDPFTPQCFASQFNHIFVVVEPISNVEEEEKIPEPKPNLRESKRGKLVHTERQFFNRNIMNVKYRVSCIYKEAIQLQSFPYLQDPCIIDPEKDHDRFITKLINCERVAMKSKEFEKRLGGVRAMLINDLYSKYDTTQKKKRGRII